MDASTYTAFRLEQQRAAALDHEHRLRVAHRERTAAVGPVQPTAGRGIRSFLTRRPAQPACDPASLALAGPSA